MLMRYSQFRNASSKKHFFRIMNKVGKLKHKFYPLIGLIVMPDLTKPQFLNCKVRIIMEYTSYKEDNAYRALLAQCKDLIAVMTISFNYFFMINPSKCIRPASCLPEAAVCSPRTQPLHARRTKNPQKSYLMGLYV